jgi:hypothetical protein
MGTRGEVTEKYQHIVHSAWVVNSHGCINRVMHTILDFYPTTDKTLFAFFVYKSIIGFVHFPDLMVKKTIGPDALPHRTATGVGKTIKDPRNTHCGKP